jgi:DNA-binding protein H-NS
VLNRVKELEDLVVTRSAEIRKEAKNSFEEAIEKAKKIKEVMHDSEMKNLELQMKHMEILDKVEEKALQRAITMRGL